MFELSDDLPEYMHKDSIKRRIQYRLWEASLPNSIGPGSLYDDLLEVLDILEDED